MMIPFKKEELVNRLLSGGKLSHKKIGKIVNVSPSTVTAIIKRGLGEKLVEVDPKLRVSRFCKKSTRCPQCGVMAFLPNEGSVCFECLVTNEKKIANA